MESAYQALAAVLPVWNLRTVYRAVDEDLVRQLSKGFYDGGLRRLPEGQSATGLDRALTVEYLPDGTGLPSADHDGVESVVAEVNRAVELVFEHARLRPRTSLAVVTGSLRHAARIGESIRLQLPNHPLLAGFFTAGDESFRVVDLERAQGLVRDHVIFSPGYGRTPHGRALHSLGPLSADGGRARFALAMTRARRSLHVLSCFPSRGPRRDPAEPRRGGLLRAPGPGNRGQLRSGQPGVARRRQRTGLGGRSPRG